MVRFEMPERLGDFEEVTSKEELRERLRDAAREAEIDGKELRYKCSLKTPTALSQAARPISATALPKEVDSCFLEPTIAMNMRLQMVSTTDFQQQLPT